ncbi:YycH family regulatory protein [Jeotgalibacillus soli]|nr:two-component system activity regulator YycH [Jeotgalibacillus soli]
MNIELFKSILLALLVVLSGVLTWNVWSYQPDYVIIERTETVDISIAAEKDIQDLVKPNRILVHNGEEVYGTPSDIEINQLIDMMKGWTLFNVRNISSEVSEEEFKNLVHGPDRVEILFPTETPFETYREVLRFEDSNLPSATFDRIVVQLDEREGDTLNIYFVLYEDRIVHEAKVSDSVMVQFNREVIQPASQEFQRYFSYDAGGQRTLFLPSQSTNAIQYKYWMNFYDPGQFQDALFSDPSLVNRNPLGPNGNEEQYIDGSSLMKVDLVNRMLNYVNPSSETEIGAIPSDLIQKSRRFVNEHEGWTDDYRLFSINPEEQQITYRIHEQGHPVFNNEGIAQIDQEWGETRIYKYDRSFMGLDVRLPSQTETKALPTGDAVISNLEKQPNFDPALLEDVIIGYHMTRDIENSILYTLEPMWYYKYKGSWQQVPIEGGGNPVGLE